LVIEIKSSLNTTTFGEILRIWQSVSWLPVPTLGFAYDGVSFNTFTKCLVKAVKAGKGVPEGVAVHQHNYVFVRSAYRIPPGPRRHPRAAWHLAVNFGAVEKEDGRASAAFLDFYHRLLTQKCELSERYLRDWFRSLDLPERALVTISEDGETKCGFIEDVAT
jgi:hypothetical protein